MSVFFHTIEWMCHTVAGPVVAVLPLRLVEVLALGLADFSFFAAGAFFVVVAFVFVATCFFGAAAFLGLASAGVFYNLSGAKPILTVETGHTLVVAVGDVAFLGAASFLASFTGPEVPTICAC